MSRETHALVDRSAFVVLTALLAASSACSNYHTVAIVPDAGRSDAGGGDSGAKDAGSPRESGAADAGGCPFPLLPDAGRPYIVGDDGGENTGCDECLVAVCGAQYACCMSDPSLVVSDAGAQSSCYAFVLCNANFGDDCDAGLMQDSIDTAAALTGCAVACSLCPF